MEFLDIVNEKDEVVGKVPRHEVYKKLFTNRIVHIFVFNKNNELALNLISKNSKSYPLHWGSSVAGHVQSGETYEQAATRELEEEIGINTQLEFVGKEIYKKENGHMKFLAVFKSIYSDHLNVNKDEIERVEFFSLPKIQEMINKKEKIAPETLVLLKKYFGVK